MYLLFDIGATKLRFTSSDDLQTISGPQIYPTPQNFQQAADLFKKLLTTIPDTQIKAVCVGVAGVFNKQKTTLVRSRLTDWLDKNLEQVLTNIFNSKVYLENDSALVGLGEATRGAGKGQNIVAYITVSTGVGGARIVDQKIDQNVLGFEPGYQIIEDGKQLEYFISGASLKQRYQQAPEEITDPKIWDEVARYLGVGLNNTIVHWSPDIVVLGGGVSQKIPLETLASYLKQDLKIFPNPPRVVRSKLGDLGGLYGGMEYLKNSL